MNSDTKVNICLVLAVIAVVLGSAGLYMAMSGDEEAPCDLADKSTLYFGLDPDATLDEMNALENAARDYVFGSGNGYTMYWAEGGYASGDTVVSGQHTLVVKVAFTDKDFAEKFGRAMMEQFGLDTVLVENSKLDAELLFPQVA